MPRVRRRDSVWTETYKNGRVVDIDYDCEEVTVYFYNSKEYVTIELEYFGSWNFSDNLNQWTFREI